MTAKKRVILRWSVVLSLVLVGLFFCLNLRINDNALDLLPEDAVLGDIQKLKNMGLVDRLFITLSVNDAGWADPEIGGAQLLKSVEQLGSTLEKSDLFSFVLFRLPKGYESGFMKTIAQSLPLLLDEADYEQLQGMITSAGITSGLDQTFALINSPAGIGMKKHVQRDPLGFTLLGLKKMSYLRSEFSMAIEDGFFMSQDNRSCLIIAEATRSLTDSKDAGLIRDFLEEAYKTSLSQNIEARVIGSLPHTLANATTIQSDLRLLLPLATVLLVLLLSLTLRSIKSFLVLGIPLMAAAPAIALTSVIHGELSRLALGFGIVLIGIAVDFSIHLYLGQKPVAASGEDNPLNQLRKPIFFATLTTAAVFIILLFSDVPSHRQMATLSLIGLLFAVVFSWFLVPTIGTPKISSPSRQVPAGRVPFLRSRIWLLVFWFVLVCAGILSWPQLRYNGDLRVLDVPDEAVMEDEKFFTEVWGEKGEQAFVLVEADTIADMLDSNYQVFAHIQENHSLQFQSLAPLLPGPEVQRERLNHWNAFWQQNKEAFTARFLEEARLKGFSERAFQPFFNWLETDPLPLTYDSYLQGTMAPLVQSMVKKRTHSPHFYAMTTIALDGEGLETLLKLQDEIPGVTVIANAKWRAAVERGLRHDVLFLSAAAGIAIVILAAIQFKDSLSVLAVLAPVFSALSAMAIFSYLTTGELNMMHLIMGIMVIGLSVDYGIFTVCACQEKQHSTSAFAVSICAASSLIGFGVLAFAQHPALHALGVTVLAGIGVAWPTALFVSPVILSYKKGS